MNVLFIIICCSVTIWAINENPYTKYCARYQGNYISLPSLFCYIEIKTKIPQQC